MKIACNISMDLDNQWTYMKIHGDNGWTQFPSYFDVVIPTLLDILDQLKLKITFFIVGQDADLDKNRDYLRMLTERGHEVGNHSFHHDAWLNSYTKEELERNVLEAEEQIVRVTGQKPIGFRGPGFSCSKKLFHVLIECNYEYDTSTLPTYIAPLARLYYFKKSKLDKEEKKRRKSLFGDFKSGIKPVKPYIMKNDSGNRLLEIPVTTIPLIKIPFHLSYLLYISRYSEKAMFFYLKSAIVQRCIENIIREL